MFPSTSARASHSSSVLSKVRTWNLHRIWPDELADLGRLAFLRPHPEPSVGAVLQWTGRERDRGEIRALPHGYERAFVSSRLALARRVVRRFAWAVRGAPRRFPRCPGPGRAQRRRRGDGGLRRGAGRLSPYAAGRPGECRIDLTMGLRPWPRLLVMLQSCTSIVNGSLQFGHVSWTKLQPSLVYDIAPQWSVQIGGFITVAGINAGRELGPTAGVWYRF